MDGKKLEGSNNGNVSNYEIEQFLAKFSQSIIDIIQNNDKINDSDQQLFNLKELIYNYRHELTILMEEKIKNHHFLCSPNIERLQRGVDSLFEELGRIERGTMDEFRDIGERIQELSTQINEINNVVESNSNQIESVAETVEAIPNEYKTHVAQKFDSYIKEKEKTKKTVWKTTTIVLYIVTGIVVLDSILKTNVVGRIANFIAGKLF